MNYLTKLAKTAEQNNSIVCIGLDPIMEKIPIKGKPAEIIPKFFSEILSAMSNESSKPSAAKLSYALYAQYGFPGLRALKRVINLCHKEKLLVILDAKRVDYGQAAAAYAKELFQLWNADAATIVPYFGAKAMQPILDYCESGKGVYLVNRVSGYDDLQNLEYDGMQMYLRISHRIIDWHKQGIGAVISADQHEFEKVMSFFVHSRKEVPIFVPDVEEGFASQIADLMKRIGTEIGLHRLNCDSLVLSHEKEKTSDYIGAAVKAFKRLNSEIGFEVQPK